jgi:hypothetical protein
MTPILVLLFRFHPATAVGTDLLYASVTKSVGTAVHGSQRTIEWRIVAQLASGSLPAAIVSLLVMNRLGPTSAHTSGVLNLLLAVALLLTGLSIFLRPWILSAAARYVRPTEQRDLALRTLLLGVMLGILVSATSVGAGALGTTALLILYPRLHVARLAATDIAHAVPLTLVAGIGHWLMGSVDVPLMLALLTGSIPGVVIGSIVSHRSPEKLLRPVMALTLVAVSMRMLAT